jgi:sorting nexin-1/2
MNRVSKLFYATGADPNADADLCRVKQAHEGNRAQGTPVATEKGGHSYSQIGEGSYFYFLCWPPQSAYNLKELLPAERRVLDAKQDFELVSFPVKLVKSEVARFEQERIEDLKKSLEHLIDDMLAR